MRQLPQIKAAYDRLVDLHLTATAGAAAQGDHAGIERLEAARDTLERGVFVLLFGQFEKAVTEVFETALRARSGNPDWSARRGWDVPSLAGRRVPFDTRLALVLDRHDPAFRRIMEAYALRNHCAHGGTDEPVGSIDALVRELYAWQGLLRR